jgi:two-component system, OmpR family, sensor histidine kinase CiaH
MIGLGKIKLSTITVVYWFLLLYIIAALVWWFISLDQQNNLMASMRLKELNGTDPAYDVKVAAINEYRNRKTAQYVGEGATFMALILIGAVFVFRAARHQLKLSQQQQNFMMAITHELKTPIAITQLNLQTLQKRRLDEDKQQKLITNTLQEANRLNDLCDNILFASRIDSGEWKDATSEVALNEMIEQSVEAYSIRFPQRNIRTQVQPFTIQGDALQLQLLINNLVENALKYSPKHQPIQLNLQVQNTKALLQVIDYGEGIAAAEKEKIFEKFYRIGSENQRTTKGTGLGLYLCKKIAEAHKANISVTENQPHGTIFTVHFNEEV